MPSLHPVRRPACQGPPLFSRHAVRITLAGFSVLAFGASLGPAEVHTGGAESDRVVEVGSALEALETAASPSPADRPVQPIHAPSTPPANIAPIGLVADTLEPADVPLAPAQGDEDEADEPQDEVIEPSAVGERSEEAAPEPPPSTSGTDAPSTQAPPVAESTPAEDEEPQEPTAPPPPPPPEAGASPAAADTIASLIQDSRSSAGLAALQRHSGADGVAQAWAEKIATDGVLAHNPAMATQLWNAVGDGAVAENVGSIRPADPAALHRSFLDSAGHRANLLGNFTYLGIGAAEDADGTLWVVQTFVQPH